MDDNAFPKLCLEQDNFQIGELYNAGVFDGKSVVSAWAKSLAAAVVGVVEASVPPTSGGGRGDGSGGGGGVSGSGGGGGNEYFCNGASGSDSGGGSGSGLGSGSSSGKVVATTMAVETAVAGVMLVAMAAMSEATVVNNTHPNAVFNATPTCQLTFYSPPSVVNDTTKQETFCAREFSTVTAQEAWDHGNIACLFQP